MTFDNDNLAIGNRDALDARPKILEHEQNSYGEYRYMMFTMPIMLDAHVVVETGLSMGDSTRIFLEALSRMDGERTLYTYEIDQKHLEYIADKIRAYQFKAHWEMMWGDCVQAGRNWTNPNIDLLYLDSDHTYDHVLNELNAWGPHMSSKGVILGDDIWIGGESLNHHDRLYTRHGFENPPDLYYAYHDWAEKNGWKELPLTFPNGKMILHRT